MKQMYRNPILWTSIIVFLKLFTFHCSWQGADGNHAKFILEISERREDS